MKKLRMFPGSIVRVALIAMLALGLFACNVGRPAHSLISQAVQTTRLNIFITALVAADMLEMLRINGPYTVFAPSDEAFQNLQAGRLQQLLKPENQEQLRSILRYHIVRGKLPASAVANLRNVQTLNDSSLLPIQLVDNNVLPGGANILQSDITADNGMIHIIDRVLMP